MATKREVLATAGLAALAGIMLAETVRSELQRSPETLHHEAPVRFEEWSRLLDLATPLMGDPSAAVHMVMFADLECAACKLFHATVDSLIKEADADLLVSQVHYPLSYHQSAHQAARGAECAREFAGEDGFRRWVATIYAGQDSLGSTHWHSYATRAGLGVSTDTFDDCIGSDRHDSRIARDVAFGSRFSISWSPQIVMNGWWFPTTPGVRDLPQIIRSLQETGRPILDGP